MDQREKTAVKKLRTISRDKTLSVEIKNNQYLNLFATENSKLMEELQALTSRYEKQTKELQDLNIILAEKTSEIETLKKKLLKAKNRLKEKLEKNEKSFLKNPKKKLQRTTTSVHELEVPEDLLIDREKISEIQEELTQAKLKNSNLKENMGSKLEESNHLIEALRKQLEISITENKIVEKNYQQQLEIVSLKCDQLFTEKENLENQINYWKNQSLKSSEENPQRKMSQNDKLGFKSSDENSQRKMSQNDGLEKVSEENSQRSMSQSDILEKSSEENSQRKISQNDTLEKSSEEKPQTINLDLNKSNEDKLLKSSEEIPQTKNQDISNLKKSLEELTHKLEISEKEKLSLIQKSQLNDLPKEKVGRHSKRISYRKSIQNVDVNSLQLEELKVELEKSQKKIKKLKKNDSNKLKEKMDFIAKLETENNSFSEEISRLKNSEKISQIQILESQNEISKLNFKISQLEKEALIFSEEKTQREKTIKLQLELSNEEIKKLKEKISNLENNLNQEKSQIQRKLDEANSSAQIQSKLDEACQLIDVLKQKKSSEKNLRKNLEIKFIESQKIIEELNTKLAQTFSEKNPQSLNSSNNNIIEQMNLELDLLESTLYFMASTNSQNKTDFSSVAEGFIDERMIILYDALVTGNYFDESTDYGFLSKVVDVMRQSYQRSAHDMGEIIFWLKQVCYFTDRFSDFVGEKNSEKLIKKKGIEVQIMALDDEDSVSHKLRFLNELKLVVLEIYKLLLALTYEDLGKLILDVAFQPIDDKGNPQGLLEPRTANNKLNVNKPTFRSNTAPILPSATPAGRTKSGLTILGPADITRFFNSLFFILEKHSLYDTIILQYYYQLYRFMDGTLFNEIIQNPIKNSNAERGFHIKIITSELESWASQHLSKKIKILGLWQYDHDSGLGYLPYTVQSCNVLVLEKTIFMDDNIMKDLIPNLSRVQLYRLLSKFQPTSISLAVPKTVLKHIENMAGGNVDNPAGISLQIPLLAFPFINNNKNL